MRESPCHVAELGELLGLEQAPVLAVELHELSRHPVERGDGAGDLIAPGQAARALIAGRGGFGHGEAELAASDPLGGAGERRERARHAVRERAGDEEADEEQQQVPRKQLRAEAGERFGDDLARDRNRLLELRTAEKEHVGRFVGAERDLERLRLVARRQPPLEGDAARFAGGGALPPPLAAEHARHARLLGRRGHAFAVGLALALSRRRVGLVRPEHDHPRVPFRGGRLPGGLRKAGVRRAGGAGTLCARPLGRPGQRLGLELEARDDVFADAEGDRAHVLRDRAGERTVEQPLPGGEQAEEPSDQQEQFSSEAHELRFRAPEPPDGCDGCERGA
jgi:hypothetical protein